MRILFHHRTRGQGAEGAHIRGVVKGLSQLEHSVSILSLPGAEPDSTKNQAVSPTKGYGSTPKRKGLFSKFSELTKYMPEFVFEFFELSYNLIAYWRVRKTVNAKKIELIYERYSLFMFASVWWAKRKNIPIILEINDSCLVQRVRPLTLKSLAQKIEKWIFKNATGLVFISSRFKEVATEAYGNIAPSVISPNAADLDNFILDDEKGNDLRVKLGVNNKIVAGYVGVFAKWHGVEWFIDEIVKDLAKSPDLVLLFIGDGVSYAPIQQKISDANVSKQVILTGRVPHNEVATYLSAMDFGVLPDSNNYGSPMKLFEFMAMEKGMVCPDFSPISEVVNDNETSWLFPANDRKACIDKVYSVAKNIADQKRVGKNARAYIEQERQWKHNAKQIISLL
jgi:glycosyltransferase involved in cell wall biosynthesis